MLKKILLSVGILATVLVLGKKIVNIFPHLQVLGSTYIIIVCNDSFRPEQITSMSLMMRNIPILDLFPYCVNVIGGLG